jgi:hypothetical protein
LVAFSSSAQDAPPAAEEGQSFAARAVERPRTAAPRSPYGELVAFSFSPQDAPPAADEGLAFVERPRTVELRSPDGESLARPVSALAALSWVSPPPP